MPLASWAHIDAWEAPLNDSGTTDWGDLTLFVERGHRYAHAPIVEALIEIQVEPLPEESLGKSREIFTATGKWIHPTLGGDLRASTIVIRGEATADASQLIGHIFHRADGARTVQARLDRFVYSSLPPYDQWETLKAEAADQWSRYVDAMSPARVSRVAVRFVNRIDVPREAFEVKDYLRTSLDLSPYLPQLMTGFFIQTEVPLPRHKATARITSATAEPPSAGLSSVLLDIDAYRQVDLALTDEGASDALWSALDDLRDAKNFVFEACITDATRGLID